MVDDPIDTVTDATGAWITTVVFVSAFVPLWAMICAVPAVTPWMSPVLVTVATPLLVDDQVTVGLLMGCPSESITVTLSCFCAPTVIVSRLGEIVTEPTGTWSTVTVASPV